MHDHAIIDLHAFADAAAMDQDPRPGTRPLEQTALGALGIELIECSARHVIARMPVVDGVTARGALLVLAETAASTAAGMAAGSGRRAFGAELNASMLRSPLGPVVIAEATPYSLGVELHVWRIVAVDADGQQVLEARCTLGVVDTPAEPVP